ncbi:MAG: GNAT family N-acetyltransferase [Oscillospiraceae bacterium]|nr:GNAT family N-acetyltransferase [Oscillospiraceae bacterium]
MNITIRKGTLADTEAYIRLLREVKDAMENQEWFFLDPPDTVREMMADGSMQLWVAEDGERLVGGFDLLLPGLEDYSYGYDLNFDEEQLLRVVQMDTAAVHPDYRGLGLQKRLMEQAQQQIPAGSILLCTIHPDNRFSLNNVLKQGYTIEKKLEKYGSVRYILRKDLR